jgi:acyl-CoA synthetase (AMP-forming)/AMP-acid ligase II
MMENGAALVAAFFGVLKAGGVMVMVNSSTKADKLGYVLNDSAARVVFAAHRLARDVLPAASSAPDLVAVVWVGGIPKGDSSGTVFEDITNGHHLHVGFDRVSEGRDADASHRVP